MSKARLEKLASFRRREAMKDKARLESLFAYAQTAPDRSAISERASAAAAAVSVAKAEMASHRISPRFGKAFYEWR